MGIFTDFRAQTSLDLTPPLAGNARVIANDIDRLEAHYGDVDYPAAFVGRAPALAILYVSGVIAGAPAVGTAEVVGSLDRGNNANAPKEVTIRALAAEVAIVENNTPLEQGILDAVRYPSTPHVGRTFPIANQGPILCWNGDCDGFFTDPFGPTPPGQINYPNPDMTVSDPDIIGAELDSVICELRITKESTGAPADWMWVNMPNAAAAGVTFTQGTGVDDPSTAITLQGTINQINAALVDIEFRAFGTPADPGQFQDIIFKVSDLGHAGVGGELVSAEGRFRNQGGF